MAFDPAFAQNGYVYVYYTATTPAVHNRISRFTANGDVAVAGSELIIFELDNLSGATNHNGGALSFGADGKLYAAVGENATPSNAQSLNNVLGKVLRINKDGSIPTDNPFYTTASGKNRAIWALGLRNPFTFAFHPFDGRLFVNDVGESLREEINDGIAGANYGWPDTEGSTSDPRFVTPRYAYSHSGACAIAGGAFYAPMTAQFPSDYANDYFFSDYCGGWIKRLDPSDGSVVTFATGIADPVDLKVADDGSLYYLARGNGAVFRVRYGATSPSITSHPSNQSVSPGTSVTFSVRASGPAPLRYQWQRNGFNISGATSQDYTFTAAAGDDGARFRASVSNDFGSVLSNEAVLTVTSNQPPTATITQPTAGTLYRGGMVINYSGTGMDPEQGSLPGSAFTWQVDFHHDTHIHPFVPATTGSTSGSFTIPNVGHTETNVWYRIYLTVRDSGGQIHTTQRDILPQKVRLTLATNPAGLQLRLDGQPVATPISFDSVVGVIRSIAAAPTQTSGSTNYSFTSWSDGGAATHDVSTPASDTTYTATYQAAPSGGISLVQRGGTDAGSSASATLAFTSANSAGNWIAVAVRTGGANDVLTITDTRGNQYRKAVQLTVTNDASTVALYYAENIQAGTNSVRVAHTQSGTLRFAILEYAGLATSNSLDVTASNQGTSTTPSSGALTTTGAGSLLLAVAMTANSVNPTAGSGFTVQSTVPAAPNAKLAVEDRIQTAAGSATATLSLNANDNWGIVFAAFRSGGAPPPPPPPPPVPPGTPASPSPADGSSVAGTSTSLSWSASGATSYDVRFGPSPTPSIVATNLTSAAYTPPPLASNTTYYWQIDARNSDGMTSGPVWRFTTAPAPTQPITFVQQASKDAGTTTSTTLAFPSANTAGNLIVVAARASSVDQVFTIGDTRGNVYRRAVQFNVTLDGVTIAIFYAENIAAGANTVTVSDSRSGTLRIAVLEYAGVATSNALGVTAAAQGMSNAPNSGTVATTTDGSLLVTAVMTANSATVTAGSGFTIRGSVPSNPGAKLAVEDRVQTSAGSASGAATLAGNDYWGVVLATFKRR